MVVSEIVHFFLCQVSLTFFFFCILTTSFSSVNCLFISFAVFPLGKRPLYILKNVTWIWWCGLQNPFKLWLALFTFDTIFWQIEIFSCYVVISCRATGWCGNGVQAKARGWGHVFLWLPLAQGTSMQIKQSHRLEAKKAACVLCLVIFPGT